jgi:hypothetical protein
MEAKLNIQQKVKSKDISLVWSYVLDFENSANPLEERKIEIQKWKGLSSVITNTVRNEQINNYWIKAY